MATEALLNIAFGIRVVWFAIETQANQAFLEDNNMVTFTDEDMEVRHLEHKGPLFIAATINQTPIKISLVDTEAFVNLIQLRTLEVAEIIHTGKPGPSTMLVKSLRRNISTLILKPIQGPQPVPT